MVAHDELVITTSWDETIRMWNVKSGTCLLTLRGHTEGIYFFLFYSSIFFCYPIFDKCNSFLALPAVNDVRAETDIRLRQRTVRQQQQIFIRDYRQLCAYHVNAMVLNFYITYRVYIFLESVTDWRS